MRHNHFTGHSSRWLLAFAAGVLGAVTLALFLAGGPGSEPGHAAGGVSLAVDADTDGNGPARPGPTDSCRQVEAGATFNVDVVVREVQGLRAFEFYFGFDATKLKVVDREVHLFLGDGARDVSNPVPDSSGAYYVGAFTLAQAASGAGVLARLTLQALAPGFSPAVVGAYPAPPALNPGSNIAIDGGITNAQIAIGADCSDAPPPGPTASPVPTPSPEPATPTPTAAPTPGPGVLHWGDTDCDASVTIGDAQKIARGLISLPITRPPDCPQIGGTVAGGADSLIWSDVDCSNAVTVGDAQKVARDLVGLTISQAPDCPALGSIVGP